MGDLTLLGAKVQGPLKKLEWFPAPKRVGEVVFTTPEFTSLCPKTGQPDFATVTITYTPRERCLESKSLKLYLWTFREKGAFLEQVSSEILGDVVEALDPLDCAVELLSNPRGGIALKTTARYHRQPVEGRGS